MSKEVKQDKLKNAKERGTKLSKMEIFKEGLAELQADIDSLKEYYDCKQNFPQDRVWLLREIKQLRALREAAHTDWNEAKTKEQVDDAMRKLGVKLPASSKYWFQFKTPQGQDVILDETEASLDAIVATITEEIARRKMEKC